jgi:membrane associated rhomboid family serine protease
MIPISDDNPVRLTPFITWAIIILCVAVFIWELSLGRQADAAVYALGFRPVTLLHGQTELAAITILTAMFVHGGFLHVGGNMLYLWIFGNNVEDAMGHVKYIVFYLISGVAATLSMAWMDPASNVPMVGASGAISGVLAAYVLLYPRARVTVIVPLGIIFYPMKISAIWVVGFWFVLQLVSAALSNPDQPGVAWWAHVGGFLVGAVLTPLFKSSEIPLFGEVHRGPWG